MECKAVAVVGSDGAIARVELFEDSVEMIKQTLAHQRQIQPAICAILHDKLRSKAA